MHPAVTGPDSDEAICVVPESIRDLLMEAARRAAPKVRKALESPREATVLRLEARPRDS